MNEMLSESSSSCHSVRVALFLFSEPSKQLKGATKEYLAINGLLEIGWLFLESHIWWTSLFTVHFKYYNFVYDKQNVKKLIFKQNQ